MPGGVFLQSMDGPEISATNPLPVTGGTGATFTLAPTGRAAAITKTRPNNTDAYGANDVIGSDTGTSSAFTFTSVAGASGGDVLITSVSLEIDITAVISGMTSFNLHLYSVTPPSALGDAATFDLPSGDRASYLGLISLGTPVDLGSTLYVEQNGVNKQVTAAGSSLFGYLVTVGAYTPAASSVFKVTIHTVTP
jgi:hypothetical protein